MAEEAWRPATPEDVPRLVELAALSVEEKRAQKGGDVWVEGATADPDNEDARRQAVARARP